MKIKDVTRVLEEFAPLAYQESYDNSGLIVGRGDAEITSAVVCVDATEEVIDEAVRLGAGLVISHHPIIFGGLKRLNSERYVERVVEKAIREGVALYACHTNLDSTEGGMSYRLAEMLGVENLQLLESLPKGNGFGVVGELATEVDVLDFVARVRDVLGVGAVRYSKPAGPKVRRVAVCTGSGGSLMEEVVASGADVYVSADFKYNHFLDATGLVTIVDAGHFETEYCAIDLICEVISKKIPTFATHKSKESHNPINYLA
ncbi:MAG: Nif3-like dinuclear metal center hexameric protein [Rikenellaceae bacterium]|nr:Nif3-like dinuclear metal center hexameric protein [Rikenellaceae bacterium]